MAMLDLKATIKQTKRRH